MRVIIPIADVEKSLMNVAARSVLGHILIGGLIRLFQFGESMQTQFVRTRDYSIHEE